MAEKIVVRINAEAEKIAKSFMNSRGLDSIGEAVEKLIGTASSRLAALAAYAAKQGKTVKPKKAKAEKKAAKPKKTKAPKKAGLAAKLSKGPKPEKKSTSKLGGNRKRKIQTVTGVPDDDLRGSSGAQPNSESDQETGMVEETDTALAAASDD